jgi:hypothetical protein
MELTLRGEYKLVLYSEELLVPPAPKLEDYLLLPFCDCLFNIFAVTLHLWRLSPPSTTRGYVMPWLERPT